MTFVMKTERDGAEIEVEFYQDADGDETWLEVAEAEMAASSVYYDAVNGTVTADFVALVVDALTPPAPI